MLDFAVHLDPFQISMMKRFAKLKAINYFRTTLHHRCLMGLGDKEFNNYFSRIFLIIRVQLFFKIRCFCLYTNEQTET